MIAMSIEHSLSCCTQKWKNTVAPILFSLYLIFFLQMKNLRMNEVGESINVSSTLLFILIWKSQTILINKSLPWFEFFKHQSELQSVAFSSIAHFGTHKLHKLIKSKQCLNLDTINDFVIIFVGFLALEIFSTKIVPVDNISDEEIYYINMFGSFMKHLSFSQMIRTLIIAEYNWILLLQPQISNQTFKLNSFLHYFCNNHILCLCIRQSNSRL